MAFTVAGEAPAPPKPRRTLSIPALLAVIIVGCIATLASVVYIAREPGLYYSRGSVIFQAPLSSQYPNRFISGSDSLTDTAGVVRDLVSKDAQNVAVVSDGVTLYSLDVKHGFSVVLPNSGGQWATNFDKPQLDVQVVGSTAEEVNQTMTIVVANINAALQALQDEAEAPQVDRITTRTDPPVFPVYFVQGSRTRAVGAAFGVGMGLTIAAAVIGRRGLPIERRR